MKRTINLWQLMGFAVTSFLGTILHFLYEWLGEATWISPFSGVNESVWEHMKLLYVPWLVFALFQSRFFRDYRGFWWVKLVGMAVGLWLIPALYYTYNGAFGQSPDWLNIALFFVAAAVTFWVEHRLFRRGVFARWSGALPFGLVALMGALFVVFTFLPPKVPLFRDPLTGKYGIP